MMHRVSSSEVPNDNNPLPVVLWKGHEVSRLPDVERRLDSLQALFEAREDDVWICAFPKCGTHWLNGILHMLKRGTLDAAPMKELLFAEMTNHEYWLDIPSPRILNTHLQFCVLPDQIKASKLIYVIRNPKDVLVSRYNHDKHLNFIQEESWDVYFERYLSDAETSGSWFSHVKGWLRAIDEWPKNILLVLYEDLHNGPKPIIQKLAQFIHKEHNDKFYDAIIKQTKMNVMMSQHKDDQIAVGNTILHVGGLFRKGIIGDWRNWFSEDQNRRFNECYRCQMVGIKLGLEKYMDIE